MTRASQADRFRDTCRLPFLGVCRLSSRVGPVDVRFHSGHELLVSRLEHGSLSKVSSRRLAKQTFAQDASPVAGFGWKDCAKWRGPLKKFLEPNCLKCGRWACSNELPVSLSFWLSL